MKDISMSVSERLKIVRKRNDSTQAEFAEFLNVSPRAYSSYEGGQRDIPIRMVTDLFYLKKIDPKWLLTGFGEIVVDIEDEKLALAASAVDQFAASTGQSPNNEQRMQLARLLNDYFDEEKTS